ncbi:MAG: AI-2E family transporter [Gammaproteobacteria bacterium]|nr:AI-2E family transporter [Gammaproteobacteria bacterium]
MYQLTEWFKRRFSDPQVVFLALALIALFAIVIIFGDTLAPFLASVIIAYLLEGLVAPLERRKVPRLLAVLIVFLGFMLFVILILFGLLPLLSQQVTQLFQQLPSIIAVSQNALMQLPEAYPGIIDAAQVQEIIAVIRAELALFGQRVVTMSVSSVVGFITIVIYTVLMPIMVFFLLKDKQRIIGWFARYLPRNHDLSKRVWHDMDRQIGNYVRGKFWEILIVWSATFATFSIMGLQFAMLLGVLVGLSVLIPFVGAAVVTVPVMVIAWFQWGWSSEFAYLMIAYLVIQLLDGNILVPLMFSEVVNLHPIAIIVAILIFGSLWGFWGIFFAIPLATLVQAVLVALPVDKVVAAEGKAAA